MDQLSHRIIIVTPSGGATYRIEEPSSPWPWTGSAVLDGGRLSGEARFVRAPTTMRVQGVVRGDRSIEVDYVYTSEGDRGRVDHHVWYPQSK